MRSLALIDYTSLTRNLLESLPWFLLPTIGSTPFDLCRLLLYLVVYLLTPFLACQVCRLGDIGRQDGHLVNSGLVSTPLVSRNILIQVSNAHPSTLSMSAWMPDFGVTLFLGCVLRFLHLQWRESQIWVLCYDSAALSKSDGWGSLASNAFRMRALGEVSNEWDPLVFCGYAVGSKCWLPQGQGSSVCRGGCLRS